MDDELFNVLVILYSFGDWFCFYCGGMEIWKDKFIDSNDFKCVREVFV